MMTDHLEGKWLNASFIKNNITICVRAVLQVLNNVIYRFCMERKIYSIFQGLCQWFQDGSSCLFRRKRS